MNGFFFQKIFLYIDKFPILFNKDLIQCNKFNYILFLKRNHENNHIDLY